MIIFIILKFLKYFVSVVHDVLSTYVKEVTAASFVQLCLIVLCNFVGREHLTKLFDNMEFFARTVSQIIVLNIQSDTN